MTESNNRPIVITMGDPSGVGPEVTVKALAALDAGERRGLRRHRRPRGTRARAGGSGIDLPLGRDRAATASR